MSSALSVAAKEFIPNSSNDDKKLKTSLSVDVPEFIPCAENVTQNVVIKKKSNLKISSLSKENSNTSKEKKNLDKAKQKLSKKHSKENFNPRHDTDWAKDSIRFPPESLSPRHDEDWFHRATSENIIKEPRESIIKKQMLRKSDSYHFNLSQKSISLRTIAERKKLVQTFSLEYSKQEKKYSKDKNSNQTAEVAGSQDKSSHSRVSWSAVVKTPASKEKLIPKNSNSFRYSEQYKKETDTSPNTGHSRDLRTKSYDVERDKRMKLNKLKKSTSVLGSFDQSAASKTILSKRFSHQTLSQSKSVGSYDFMLDVKPKKNIQRKSLVLQAKLSAGLRQDPKMDNWFDKEVPKAIERLSTISNGNTDQERKCLEENKKKTTTDACEATVKRKLTRTTKKVFSPLLKDIGFTNEMSSRSLNDDYFMNEKYNADLSKKENENEQEDNKDHSENVSTESLINLHKKLSSSKSSKTSAKRNAWNIEPTAVELPLQETPVCSGTISYSAILKKSPSTAIQSKSEVVNFNKIPEKKILTADEIRLYKKTKKKEKKKMKKEKRKEEVAKIQRDSSTEKKNTSTTSTVSKLSQKGISFDFSDMFDKLLVTSPSKQGRKNKHKKAVVSTGVISVVSGLAKKNTTDGKKTARNKYGGTGIIMDGATPIVKRGKERQTPKKKKPTLLKKIIKAERERKHQLHQMASMEEEACSEHVGSPLQESNPSQNNSTNKETVPDKNNTEASLEKSTDQENIPRTALTDLPEEICNRIHSRKFREYCDHLQRKEINNLTHELLITLQKFQDRVYHESPMKFKQKRRFVLGLREVLKHVKLKRIKTIIIAPNLERISSEGGLDDYLRNIISLCDESEIPKIFAMNRHALGKTLKKKAPVSVIGIFNYDGAQDTFKDLMNEVDDARKAYQEKVRNAINQQQQEANHPLSQKDQQHQLYVSNPNQAKTMHLENIQHPPPTLLHNNEGEQLKQRMLNNLSKGEFLPNEEESHKIEKQSWDTIGMT